MTEAEYTEQQTDHPFNLNKERGSYRGELMIFGLAPPGDDGRVLARVRCVCGSTLLVPYSGFVEGWWTRCGQCSAGSCDEHEGQTGVDAFLLSEFRGMWSRCRVPRKGGPMTRLLVSGVGVPLRWKCYHCFAEDVGRPTETDGVHLCRRDPFDHYTAENCYWGRRQMVKRFDP